MLAGILSGIQDESGSTLFHVTARNRDNLASGDDRIMSKLDESDFDELWLFGVDVGGGLGLNDCAAIGRFRERGGAILTSRDHQDLGISFCILGGIGAANHFHSKNPEPDPARRAAGRNRGARCRRQLIRRGMESSKSLIPNVPVRLPGHPGLSPRGKRHQRLRSGAHSLRPAVHLAA